MIKKEDLTYTKILEAISIYLFTFLFIKTLLDITKNTSSFFFTLFSFNREFQIYLLFAIQIIKITHYFIF